MRTVSVVIPCHNEEVAISKVISSLPESILEVVVVDNNSTDNTASIAASLGARVVTESRQGAGFSLMKGLKEAKGDIIITLDGDCQYPSEAILGCVDYFEKKGFDFMVCSRFPLFNKDSMNIVRRFGNWFLTAAMAVLFKKGCTDSTSGMMCMRRSLLEKLSLKNGGFPFANEVKIRAIMLPGINFGEMHIDYHPREGKSKLSPLRHGFEILMYYFILRRELRG